MYTVHKIYPHILYKGLLGTCVRFIILLGLHSVQIFIDQGCSTLQTLEPLYGSFFGACVQFRDLHGLCTFHYYSLRTVCFLESVIGPDRILFRTMVVVGLLGCYEHPSLPRFILRSPEIVTANMMSFIAQKCSAISKCMRFYIPPIQERLHQWKTQKKCPQDKEIESRLCSL